MKISLIVAAYNVEKYIERCINSLIGQSYSDLEIVLVNDCSTDKTLDICKEYEKKDPRIVVVDKKVNQGLSEARNSGIDVASGEYLTFVDGDDFLEENTIGNCVDKLLKLNADELVFGSCFDRSNGESYKMDIISSKEFYSGQEDMKLYFNEAIGSLPSSKSDRNIGITPWGRIYKKSIIDKFNLRFISERELIYEDLTFFLISTKYFFTVSIINEPFYHYCENQGSLTQKCDLERFDKVKKMYLYIKKQYKEEIFENTETLLRFKRQMISYIRLSVMQLAQSRSGGSHIKAICNDSFTKEVLENYPINRLPLKQRIFAYLLDRKLGKLLYIVCKCNS